MEHSVYIARQPIFDAAGQIVAYELLYRDTAHNRTLVDNDMHATARVLVNALNYIGLNTLTRGKTAYVKVDDKTLKDDIVYTISPTHFVLEILERSNVTEELVRRIAYLKGKGYRFALNHYTADAVSTHTLQPLLPYLDSLKIDLQTCTAPGELLKSLSEYPLTFIAEHIENDIQYAAAKAAGFQRFQGYFLAKPHMMKKAQADPETSEILQIIYRLKTNASIGDLIDAFNASPYLTVNLLKFIRVREGLSAEAIASMEQALILIGRERLCNWLELMVYADGNETTEANPYAEQLSEQARHRACLMEEVAKKVKTSTAFSEAAYMTGLLSMSEMLFQDDFDTLIRQMTIDKNIADALIKHNGELGQLLELSIAVERNDIHRIHSISGQLFLSQQDLNACLLASYRRSAAAT